jgi:hypothetical protein
MWHSGIDRSDGTGANISCPPAEELNMSMAGLSKPRLDRMHQVLSGYVERKEIPGLVALVSHYDDVHVETLGTMAVDRPAPMKRDTIFRDASQVKPPSPQLRQ